MFRTFRFLTISINVLTVCWAVISIIEGQMRGHTSITPLSPKGYGVLFVIIALCLMHIYVAIRWLRNASRGYSRTYKFFRSVTYYSGILFLIIAGHFFRPYAAEFWFCLPAFLLGWVSFYLTVVIEFQEKRGSGLERMEDAQTYYQAHRAEIDAMMEKYCALMVESYGFRPEFVSNSVPAEYGTGLPLAVYWHVKGKTAEEEAAVFFKYYRSVFRGDPEIFSRDIDTGEAINIDLEKHDFFSFWRGLKPMQVVRLCLWCAGLSALIMALWMGEYRPSFPWMIVSVLTAFFVGRYYYVGYMREVCEGGPTEVPGTTRSMKTGMEAVSVLACCFSFMILFFGVGSVLNYWTATSYVSEHWYVVKKNTPCMKVELKNGIDHRPYCPPVHEQGKYAPWGRAQFTFYKSFFGVAIVEMSSLGAVYQEAER